MKRNKSLAIVGTALLLFAALGTFFFLRARRGPGGPPPRVLELAQSVSPDFTAPLEALLAPYLAVHTDMQVNVRYQPYPRASSSVKDAHVALRALAAESEGSPLFAADYVVLAYNRELVGNAPTSWPELLGKARSLKERGKVSYGVALPEEAYTLFPFFADALKSAKEEGEARAEEAFSFLFDLRFASGLTPHQCPSECAVRLFQEGKAPYLLTGEWRLAEVRAALGDKLGLTAVPALSGSDAKLRSARTLYGLVIAGDADPATRTVTEALVRYLKDDCRDRLLRVVGKLPFPATPPKDPTSRDGKQEAELAAVIAEGTVDATPASRRTAVERLSPVWDRFAAGELGPGEASRQLIATRLEP